MPNGTGNMLRDPFFWRLFAAVFGVLAVIRWVMVPSVLHWVIPT